MLQYHCFINVADDEHSILKSIDTDGAVGFGHCFSGLDARGLLEIPPELKRL